MSSDLILSSDTATHQRVGAEFVQDVSCANHTEVQDFLRLSRKYVDNLTYHLNRSGEVREGDKVDCETIWHEMHRGFMIRDQLITRCIREVEEDVRGLENELEAHPNPDTEQDLHRARYGLRQIKAEPLTEQLLLKSSREQFKKRCRHDFYRLLREMSELEKQ